jgi:hypothetical protein
MRGIKISKFLVEIENSFIVEESLLNKFEKLQVKFHWGNV